MAAAFTSAPVETSSLTPSSITDISASTTSSPSSNGTITTSPTSTFTDDLGSWACASSASRGNLFENFSGCTYLHSSSATISSASSTVTSANGTISNGTTPANGSSVTGIPMPTETDGAAIKGTQMSGTLALAMLVIGLVFGR